MTVKRNRITLFYLILSALFFSACGGTADPGAGTGTQPRVAAAEKYRGLDAGNGFDVYATSGVYKSVDSFTFFLKEHTEDVSPLFAPPSGYFDFDRDGVSGDVMKEILSEYGVGRDDVHVVLFVPPTSSYIPEYLIFKYGQSVEEKQKPYVDAILDRLFGPAESGTAD